MKKCLTLLSGGLDSCTALAIAVKEYGAENVTAVSVDYNQKHNIELEKAKEIVKHYEVDHRILNLKEVYKDSNCALLKQSSEEIPEGSYVEQLQGRDNGVLTAVPFRNGLMLSAVAGLAQSLYPEDEIDIYIANHADDAAGNAYADCSEEFIDAIGHAIYIGTYKKVTVVSPFVDMNKAEIVAEGLKLHAPYHLTTSCYNGNGEACGIHCATCIDRVNAFRVNKVIDPIKYATDIDWTGCRQIDYLKDVYDD